ncbi:MAG TPA: hypothetical protein VFA77_17510, partial [Candidatus Eisenbacteria bacterium]|nr:hypothetical protein [Candidatus Eisenbacteria bacterium]
NGRIDPAKDIDRFKFKSDKDQKLICEVLGQRFGSPLDALLVLTDAEGKVIQQNDDSSGADARIEFDAKSDAEYTLSLRDLTDRGDENFSYRLSIRTPAAGAVGFAARFLPDTVRVHRGGLAKLRCELTRNGGFDGPVRFAFQDLPSGVFGEPIVLTGTPSSGLMALTALDDAPLGNFPVKMMATAIVGGKTVAQTAEALSGDKPAKEAFLTVLDAAPFTLELVTLTASLEQNQSAAIEVMPQRREGFTGDIKLSAEGFSEGRDAITKSFEVGGATLKGSDALGKISLKAKSDSEIGTRTIVIRGDSTVDGKAVTQYSLPIPVTVIQNPFVLSSLLSKLSVTALPPGANSAANETETKIKVDRRAGFAGELALTVEGLPEGIIATVDKIPTNAVETVLKIKATDKAPTGKDITFTVVGAGTFNDRNYKTKTGNITLSVAAPTETAEPAAKPAPAGATK